MSTVLQSASSAITPFFTSLASGDESSNSASLTAGNTIKPVFVNESCLEFLLMEMVDLMFRSTADSENDKEAVFYKLEMLGYQVGQSLVERFTRERPRFVDTLDVGVYVLQDNNFRWFVRMSTEAGGADAAKRAVPYLWFPCGLIRGALANLGVISVVVAETNSLPQCECTFQIKIAKS
ncbi:5354_t:CDS:2 [Diversispora eburnea]|uniref:5354_t:CDS:1 n=1 Tax=Diversispora eburnea TaxID=1213867 RepID=A0A9N8UZY4_9GLOM|nr:5354_t:CDS:2 [Diversispora eburnea]